MNENYYAVIMAGGGGTRLWPLSRQSRPKQMLRLGNARTMFQLAIDRLEGLFPADHIFVVTVSDQVGELQRQCPAIPDQNYLIEPLPRGTASVVGYAAVALQHRDRNAIMTILTADHFIRDIPGFQQLLIGAYELATMGKLVTLGIQPEYPATGYGYIERGDEIGSYRGKPAFEVLKFKEKPDEDLAAEFVRRGDHYWNSGMFIWQAGKIMREFSRQMPELYAQLDEISRAWDTKARDEVVGRIWPGIHPQTIDYGIMENAGDVCVLQAEELGWNDVGSWESLFDVIPPDENGNLILDARHIGLGSSSTLVCSDSGERLIATIGLRNLIIVDTGDVVLVCPREDSQRVREMVNILKQNGYSEYLQEMFPVEAYCVKCRTKREIQNPQADFNAVGAPVTKGVCPVCGTKLFRTGRTEAHEGLEPPVRNTRNGKLVIVESPAKAKTVGRFLGKGFTVKASVGHVRDLLRSELSVDVENNFQPKYRVPNEKRPVVKELKQLAKKAEEIYLATDPDREGEAIAWHLMEAADIPASISHRVVFHEITEPAVAEAFAHPRDINMKLVDAQQARRVLDRLVGYGISPILWEKVRSRLSAGRVQSVALRLIVEREREIEAFNPQEYWTIKAEFRPEGGKTTYVARLSRIDEKEPQLPDEEVVKGILTDMEQAGYVISKIKKGERRRKPNAPFITSTLQQEASRRLGYTAKRTMALAQQLYEGLDVGEGGNTGLITYMRTDSTQISELALQEVRQFIGQTYGESYLPEKPPQYKTKAKGAQEAHEAVRPTSVLRQPEKVKALLTRDQFRLYQLIWQRFVASQMEAAVYDTVSVEVIGKTSGHEYLLRASGSTLKFSGYLVVYEESQDEDQKSEESEDVRIPPGLEENQKQELDHLIPEQHFTQPPPRYTEASLVQILEEYGIGRPSTYAPILSTILDRGYVERENKRLSPTETGIVVNDLLVDHFSNIVDTNFTANLEEELDKIANGNREWTALIGDFYTSFGPQLKKAQEEIPVSKAELEKVGRACPECGHDLVIRWGRYGKFISCSNFPECRYTEAWLEKIGVKCPEDGGEVVLRKTRRGRIFYGCANYPECQFTSWKRPVPTPCPSCDGLLVIANKRELQCMKCEETFLAEQFEDAAETA